MINNVMLKKTKKLKNLRNFSLINIKIWLKQKEKDDLYNLITEIERLKNELAQLNIKLLGTIQNAEIDHKKLCESNENYKKALQNIGVIDDTTVQQAGK